MKRVNRHKAEYEDVSLNLNPMLDIFVALIPILLLTASLSRFSALQTTLPSASESSIQDVKKDQEVRISVEVRDNEILIAGFTHGFDQPLSAINSAFSLENLEGLKAYLKGIKSKYPKMGPSLFYASGATQYQKAIDVLDTVRTTLTGTDVILAAGVIE